MTGKAIKNLTGYDHKVVVHSVKEYARETGHTNGIESFRAMFERGYKGTYHKMSEKHLQRYANEFAGRHNARPLDIIDQMESMVKNMEGKRLKFKDLVAGEDGRLN